MPPPPPTEDIAAYAFGKTTRLCERSMWLQISGLRWPKSTNLLTFNWVVWQVQYLQIKGQSYAVWQVQYLQIKGQNYAVWQIPNIYKLWGHSFTDLSWRGSTWRQGPWCCNPMTSHGFAFHRSGMGTLDRFTAWQKSRTTRSSPQTWPVTPIYELTCQLPYNSSTSSVPVYVCTESY